MELPYGESESRSYITRALTQRMAEEKKHSVFLSDPNKSDNLVAAITAHISPSTEKPSTKKFATKTEAFDSVIPDDHPLKGFGPELKERLNSLLRRPDAVGVDPGEVGQLLAQKMLNEPGKAGAPRIWEANEYKRRADSRWFNLLGPDTKIRKPLGSQYDEWLGRVREAEKPANVAAELRKIGKTDEAQELLTDRSPVATPGGLFLNMGAGAVGGAMVAGPPGAMVGAVGGIVSEIGGRPIHEWIRQSEWYNAKWGPLTASREASSVGDLVLGAIGGGLLGATKGLVGAGVGALGGAAGITDTGKQFLTDIAPYAVGNVAVDKVLMSALLVPKAAGKAIAANPSAKNIAEAADAIAGQKKLMSDEKVVGRIVNKLFTSDKELGINEDYLRQIKEVFPSVKRRRLVIEQMEKQIDDYLANPANQSFNKSVESLERWKDAKLRVAFRQFDSEAMDDFLTHKDFRTNPVDAVEYAASRQHARNVASDFMNGTTKAYDTAMDLSFKVSQQMRRKPEEIVAEALRKTTIEPKDFMPNPTAVTAKVADGSLAPGVRIAPTATAAETVDDYASVLNMKPTAAFDEIKKVADTYEDPVAKSVIETVTAPTDIEAAVAPEIQAARPMRTAKKLSEAQQLRLLQTYKRLGLEDEAFELSKKLRGERQAETAALSRHGGKTLKELEAETIAERQAAEAAQAGKKGRKKGSAETPKFEDKVATEAELNKPDVIRGKAEKAAAEARAAELNAQKTKETADISATKALMDLDPDQASKQIQETAEAWKTGKTTAEDALHKINQITEAMVDTSTDKFVSEDALGQWLAQSDTLVSHLRKVVGTKTFMATFGVPAGLLAYFLNPTGDMNTAQAGTIDSVVKGLGTVKDAAAATASYLKNVKAAGYMVEADVPATKYLLRDSEFQRGLRGGSSGGAAEIIKNFNQWRSNAPKGDSFRHKWLMSPGMVFDEVLGIGKNLMTNPAVFKASYQAAEYNNIQRGMKVFGNILDASGIKSAHREVREAMAPLTEDMYKQVEYEWRKFKVEHLDSEVKKLTSKLDKSKAPDVDQARIDVATSEIANHKSAMESLGDASSDLKKRWMPIAEKLANEHSSVRVFLAAGENANYEKYPFLRNIKFTSDEMVAIGRIREQMLHYKNRIKEVKEETISGNYMPHVMHPDFDTRRFVKTVGNPNEAEAFMRFHRRSFNSLPLMPDLETSLMKYVGDTERRIQQRMFWKIEGWERVMNMSQDIPVIYNAFKNLRDGVRPSEMTASNKILQRYMEFEATKRLFLSPSATLKHLIKQTGDIAQRGLGETLEAYPANTKMVGIRMAEANPIWRKTFERLGITAKTDQDRMMQDYFKSVVPAHGTRRMVLDLGLDLQDELFARAKSVWGKIQDIGGAGINMAEVLDRGLSVTLGKQIAEKQGMTIEQALYGTYDMILKNNFLSREFNPRWLNNPKVRAMAMFQGTPFKIFERRLVNAIRTGRVVRDLGEDIFNATKKDRANGNFNETRTILRDLRNLRQYIKDGEHIVQANTFVHTALQQKDFFGSSVMSNFAKDIMLVGAATYGGSTAGMSLYHHFFHLPFLQSTTDEPTLNLNPGITAINRGIAAWKRREEGDDEFLVTKIFQRWLGSGWYAAIPDPIRKLHKISTGEIPEIYQGSKYKYLFAIPSSVKN